MKKPLTRLAAFSKANPYLVELIGAPLAILSLFYIAFGQFLDGKTNIAINEDNLHLMAPIFHAMSQTLSQGEFPYWMNTIIGGLPLYNNPQFSALYPFYFLQPDLYATPLQGLTTINNLIFLHFLILYINTYVMLRIFTLRFLPALMGASIFAFGPTVLSYGPWLNIVAPYSWVPLAVGAVFLVCENKQPRVGILLGILSLSLLILAAPSHPLIHITYVIALMYLVTVVRYLVKKDLRTLIIVTRNLAVMGLITLAIGSPSLIPALLDTKNMVRYVGTAGYINQATKMPFQDFLVFQYQPQDLVRALLPLKFPRFLGDPYIGLIAVFLSFFSVFLIRRNWIIGFLIFLALYGLLSSTGSNLGFAQVNYELPFINQIRQPGRHLILYALATAALTGFGFTYLVEIIQKGYRYLFNWYHGICILLFAVIFAITLLAGPAYTGPIKERWLLLFSAGVLGLLLLIPLVRNWQKGLICAFAVLLVIFVSVQYDRYVPPLTSLDYFKGSNLTSYPSLEELSQLEDIANYRIAFDSNQLNSYLWAMQGSFYGLRTLEGYMSPLPQDQFNQLFFKGQLEHYFALLGVKYVLCDPCNSAYLADYTYQRDVNGLKLYADKNALPRYQLINRVAGSYKSVAEFFNIIREGYDFNRAVYLPPDEVTPVQNWLGQQAEPVNYILKEEKSSSNNIRLSVNSQGRTFFVLNEFYNDAWKVKVNGVEAKIFKANLNQVGVLLDKGANFIEFDYHPDLFIDLIWLNRIVIALVLGYVAYIIYLSKPLRVIFTSRTNLF